MRCQSDGLSVRLSVCKVEKRVRGLHQSTEKKDSPLSDLWRRCQDIRQEWRGGVSLHNSWKFFNYMKEEKERKMSKPLTETLEIFSLNVYHSLTFPTVVYSLYKDSTKREWDGLSRYLSLFHPCLGELGYCWWEKTMGGGRVKSSRGYNYWPLNIRCCVWMDDSCKIEAPWQERRADRQKSDWGKTRDRKWHKQERKENFDHSRRSHNMWSEWQWSQSVTNTLCPFRREKKLVSLLSASPCRRGKRRECL